MARRKRTTQFKLPGLRQYIDQVGKTIAAACAEEIVTDLKKIGPYFSGEFEENWVVVAGDKRIPADKILRSPKPKNSRPGNPPSSRSPAG